MSFATVLTANVSATILYSTFIHILYNTTVCCSSLSLSCQQCHSFLRLFSSFHNFRSVSIPLKHNLTGGVNVRHKNSKSTAVSQLWAHRDPDNSSKHMLNTSHTKLLMLHQCLLMEMTFNRLWNLAVYQFDTKQRDQCISRWMHNAAFFFVWWCFCLESPWNQNRQFFFFFYLIHLCTFFVNSCAS